MSLSAQVRDYLITHNPASVILYDKYQRAIPEYERRQFPRNTPWLIINESIYLSDQFTPVMKLQYMNETFFVRLDENGKIAATAPMTDPEISIYKNCMILDDTLQIINDQKVALRKTPGGGEIIRLLSKDELLKTIFRYQNYIFLHSMDQNIQYGWVVNNQRIFWNKVDLGENGSSITIPENIRKQVTTRIEHANRLYLHYFQWMNEQNNKQYKAPKWDVEVNEKQILCSMKDTSFAGDLEKSTAYLVQDLGGFLIGTPFKINSVPGKIKIYIAQN